MAVKIKRISPEKRQLALMQAEQDRLNTKVSFLGSKICSVAGISKKDFFVGKGTKSITNLRWVLWTTLRAGGYTLQQIAEAVGKHHTTVLYQLNKPCPKGYEKLLLQLTKLSEKWDRNN